MAREDFSAGGVVLREDHVIVIVPRKRALDGSRVLGLPKGHPDGDETPEQAATREVREEAGVIATLLEPLGEVAYTYPDSGREVLKRVRFFLFEYVAGSVEDHDHEIEEARWMPLERAIESVTYDGEREMLSRALSRRQLER